MRKISLLRRIELARQCCRQIDSEQSGAKYLGRRISQPRLAQFLNVSVAAYYLVQ